MRTPGFRIGTKFGGALFIVSSLFCASASYAGTARIPLMDMQPTEDYYGFQGGLYPNGTNVTPLLHHDAGIEAAEGVIPRDTDGNPDEDGAIVLLSLGMSNTTMEFDNFRDVMQNDIRKNPRVRILDGALGNQVAFTWESPTSTPLCQGGQTPPACPANNYDRVRDTVLAQDGKTEAQVQAVWVKIAEGNPSGSLASGATSTSYASRLEAQVGNIARALKARYPNLKQVFLSSRIYGGNATTPLNPEPYAYEAGFTMKWVIEAQINQMTQEGIDPVAGDLDYASGTAPWLAWGPYLWADGLNTSSAGLHWAPTDFVADGTHPSLAGQVKVEEALSTFFLESQFTPWFVQNPNPEDVTPPTISNVQVANITASTATVTWTTDESSTTVVKYGTTSTEYAVRISAPARVTSHSRNLSGLQGATEYHYRVCSSDASMNEVCAEDATFTTSAPDTVAPVISNVTSTAVTPSSTSVSWTTNEASTSVVEYGTSTSYGMSVSDSTLITAHTRTLIGLLGSTLYHYRVCSADVATNQSCSSDATFTTATSTAQPSLTLSRVGTTTQMQWTSTGGAGNPDGFRFVASKTINPPVFPGTFPTTGYLTAAYGTGGPVWSVTMSAFNGNGTYYMRVCAYQTSTNSCTLYSNVVSMDFGAPSDTTPPVISSVQTTNVTSSAATVTWTTNESSTTVVQYGLTTSYGATSTDSTLVTSHSRSLTGLSASTTYQYRVCSVDAAGNQACSSNGTFTTTSIIDTTAPVISNVQVSNITSSGATVTWTTNEQATRFVEYGETESYGSSTGTSTPLLTSHSVVLSGLAQSTTYHLRVRSMDAAENESFSTDVSFETTTPDTTAPVISSVQVTTTTASGATIAWSTDETSTTVIEYGITTGYGSSSTDGTLVTSHSRTLTGLSASTTYQYRVCSTDAALNQSCSSNGTFTTAQAPSASITMTRVGTTSQFQWTVTGGLGNPDGFRFVASKTVNPPVYPGTPPVTGYLTIAYGAGGPTWSTWMSPFAGSGTYYVRACAYQASNNSCTVYSNLMEITY